MEQKPSLLRQHIAETAQVPDEKQAPFSSAASQLRENFASVAHPIPPAINFEVAQAPPARPPRLAQRNQTHSARNAIDISIVSPNPGQQEAGAGAGDGDGAGRSARGEAALENGAHANAGPDEKRDASVSIRCLASTPFLPAAGYPLV
jgi:hypothetical protein